MLDKGLLEINFSSQQDHSTSRQFSQAEIQTILSSLKVEPEVEKYYYYLFVNPKSGDKEGLKYLTLSNKTIVMKFPQKQQISIVQIFDMFNSSAVAQGMAKAKSVLENQQPNSTLKVRIIVCGGDGTIEWVLSSARQANIDLQKVCLGILPIGTGNDFSRSLGWGYKAIHFTSKKIAALYYIVQRWNLAKQDYYDIWDCQITTYEDNGCFYNIKNQKEMKIQKKIMKKSFTNYIGIGLDARIVYTVEKNRGRNAFITKLLYTGVGIYNFCKHLRPIDEYLSNLQEFPEASRKKSMNQSEDMITRPNQSLIQQSFETGQGSQLEDLSLQNSERNYSGQAANTMKNFRLGKGYRGLVCLNCTSYMSGIRNIWRTKKSISGLSKNKFQEQKTNDGLIEFVAFKNQLSLALERISRNGVKVAQGKGSYLLQFKKPNANQKQTTFMEVDGQSLKVINIESLKISKSQKYSNGRIKVIKRQALT